jgi:phage terminase large subunit GpA-like protein
MGKTTSFLNVVGRKLDDDPAPIMYVGPTKSNLESVVEPQVTMMLISVPSLREKMPANPKKQKKLLKRVAGVTLRLAWAGSPTELAAQPAHTVIIDERDKMPAIPGEGDPVTLALARKATYADGKALITSSPTEGTVTTSRHPVTGIEHFDLASAEDLPSPIWRLWQEGTRHEWAVACKACFKHFVPRFKHLRIPKDATAREARRGARVICPNCDAEHSDADKNEMNATGRAISPGQSVDRAGNVVGEGVVSDTFSLWVSGLMSPWVTFGQRAAAWVRAMESGDQDRIRAEINTAFGELYQLRGQAPEWSEIKSLGAAYKLGDVPAGVRKILMAVDVQKNRLVLGVRGFGTEYESWLLHREELWGDTDKPEVYARLSQVMDRKFGELPISAVAIDSGFRTDRVYEWCYRRGLKAYATKGRDRPTKLYFATDVEVNRFGKKLFAGLKLWTIDASYFKGWVHERLRWPQEQPGAWHLPVDVPDDYCKELVNEAAMRLPSGEVKWVRRGANHALDIEALLVFLAHIEGVRYLKPPSASAPRVAGIAPAANMRALAAALNGGGPRGD